MCEATANIGPRRMAAVILLGVRMVMRTVRVRMIVRMSRACFARRMGRRVVADKKAASGQGVIAMGNEPAFGFGAKLQRGDRRSHWRPEIGKRVEKRGDEHIARPASERIEMNIQQALQFIGGVAARPRKCGYGRQIARFRSAA